MRERARERERENVDSWLFTLAAVAGVKVLTRLFPLTAKQLQKKMNLTGKNSTTFFPFLFTLKKVIYRMLTFFIVLVNKL